MSMAIGIESHEVPSLHTHLRQLAKLQKYSNKLGEQITAEAKLSAQD